MEPIDIPIDGVLDLHTFRPKEIPDLLQDYLPLCREKGILQVRIIHGKGRGILKARVHSLLKKNPLVIRFSDAPADVGGWGATLVELLPG
jgi:DNA-nicking Smr family endonuclease